MARYGFLSYGSDGWTLSVGAEQAAFADYAEATDAAEAALGGAGGGIVFVSPGPGVKAGEFRVESTPQPPAAAAFAEALEAAEAPAAELTDLGAELDALRAAYETAAETIEGFEEVERDIGRGTLRLEADHTLAQLSSPRAGIAAPELKGLTNYVNSLSGGTASVLGVRAFEKARNKVMRDVLSSLLTLSLKGSLVFIAGLLAYSLGQAAEAGAGLAAIVVAGGGGVVLVNIMRAVFRVGPAAGRFADGVWEWASHLGEATERTMAEPRRIEERLLQRCGGLAAPPSSLARRGRVAAMTVVAIVFLLVLAGLLAFGAGVWAYLEQSAAPIQPPPFEP